MSTIKQTSTPARTTRFLLALLGFLLVTIAVHPTPGLAAPLEEEPPPQLSFDPGSYDFGLQQVESGGNQANFQLRNEGVGEVRVNNLSIVGSGSDGFWFGYDNCSNQTLQSGQSCFVGVNFNPHAMTGYSAQLQASVGGSVFSAELSGSGGRAIVEVDSNPANFGVAKVDSEGVTREIEVDNSGNLPAGFFIAVISGGAVGSFQLLDENCTGHLLMPSSSCTLQVSFQPLSEGVKTATLSLFGDGNGAAQVILTGVGVGVGAAADPAQHAPFPSLSGPQSAPAEAGAAAPRRARHHRGRAPRRNRRAAIHAARRLLTGPVRG